jgi:hypothetical protein
MTNDMREVGRKPTKIGLEKDQFYTGGLDDTEEKRKIRLQIAKFFAENHPGKGLCLCFPGTDWRFEHMLADLKSDMHFLGIEKDVGIFEKGKLFMPGDTPMHSEVEMNFGKIQYYMTAVAKYVNLDIQALLGLEFADSRGSPQPNRPAGVLGGQKKRWNHFRRKLGLWTCAWLDFYGSVQTITPLIKRLDRFTQKNRKRVPLAISFFVGRETNEMMNYIRAFEYAGGPAEQRGMLIAATLNASKHRTFKPVEVLKYSHMGVLLGFSELR